MESITELNECALKYDSLVELLHKFRDVFKQKHKELEDENNDTRKNIHNFEE